VADDQNSLTAGARGPLLMQDVHLLEKLAHFDRERIPERVVHAKGAGAGGYFEVTADVTRYTKAKFLSAVGKRTEVFVRFSPVGGEKGSADAARDLYEAIARGDYPSWTLEMQILTPEQAKDFRWDIFDITKVWPHREVPPLKIGKLVLNRNPENYFAEVEQAAFCPGNVVPGIAVSPDKMLQARVFSYHDTHIHRLGPNYHLIPVNAPKAAPEKSYQRDGFMRVDNGGGGGPNYWPNSLGGPRRTPPRASRPLR
jgi:catalase